MSKLRECVSKMGFAWGFRAIGFQIETENGSQKTTVSHKMSELHLHDVLTSEAGSFYHMSIIQLSVTLISLFLKTRGFQCDMHIYVLLLIVPKLFLLIWLENYVENILFGVIIFFI